MALLGQDQSYMITCHTLHFTRGSTEVRNGGVPALCFAYWMTEPGLGPALSVALLLLLPWALLVFIYSVHILQDSRLVRVFAMWNLARSPWYLSLTHFGIFLVLIPRYSAH